MTKFTTATKLLAGLLFSYQACGSTITNSQGVPFDGTPTEPGLGETFEITDGLLPNDDTLLFSFNEFTLDDNDTAVYQNPQSLGVSRIINRVLGGAGSTIGGTINTSQFEGADYYFIDPKGITFHGSAQLDIRGSFFASTAGGLKLGNSVISIYDDDLESLGNTPISFVIEDGSDGKIRFLEPEVADPASTTLDGNDFLALAANIEFTKGRLKVEGGNIFLLTSTDKNGELNVSEVEQLIATEGLSHGNITLKSSNIISINSMNRKNEPRGGGIYISTADLLLNPDPPHDDSSKITSNVKDQSANKLFIRANGSVILNDASTLKSINTINSTENTPSQSLSLIEIVGFKRLEISNGSTITSSVSRAEYPLVSGSINLVSPNSTVTISGGSRISADSSGGSNKAGEINIATDSLHLEDKAEILVSSSGFEETESGDINIQARFVEIDESSISSAASGSAKGGTINIHGFESAKISNDSTITSSSFGSGEGGEITLDGATIYVKNNSTILSQSEAPNEDSHSGTGGNISVIAQNVLLSGERSKISAEATQSDAGDISLESSGLISLKGSEISTSVTDLSGSGGNISFNGTSEMSTLHLGAGGLVKANTQKGRGGLISLKNSSVLGYKPGANITAAAGNREGIDGEVRFINSTIDSASGTEELPENILDTSTLTSKRCHDAPGGRSNFVINDKQGVKSSPADLIYTENNNPTHTSSGGPRNKRIALERAKLLIEPVFFTCQNQLR